MPGLSSISTEEVNSGLEQKHGAENKSLTHTAQIYIKLFIYIYINQYIECPAEAREEDVVQS